MQQNPYLYRAIDTDDNTIDFYLSSNRNSKAAKKFLSKALKSIPERFHPRTINTDKNSSYISAIEEINKDGNSINIEQ